MGPGIVLIILGAILTFAVRGDTNFVNLHVVGVIFLVVGGTLIYFGRNGGTRATGRVSAGSTVRVVRSLAPVRAVASAAAARASARAGISSN